MTGGGEWAMEDSTPHDGSDVGDLFTCLRDASLDPSRRRRFRDAAVERHLSLVDRCALDLNIGGHDREDLIQAGRVGLIHAVDRFDPERGIPFVGFARPTITGEMLRYLRDHRSTVRLPRRHHNITHASRASRDHLRHTLRGTPDNAAYAEFLGLSVNDVDAAFAAEAACTVLPLESGDENPRDRCLDRYLESTPERIDLERSIAGLPVNERRVIALHIYEELTQQQVAARLNMSQVQVSRTLQRAIRHLRKQLTP